MLQENTIEYPSHLTTKWKVSVVNSHFYSIKHRHMNVASISIPICKVCLDYFKACYVFSFVFLHFSLYVPHIYKPSDQVWTSLITFDLCCKISSFFLEISRHFTLNLFFLSLDLFTTFRSRKVQFQSCLK